jgi:hypothetical protein
MYQKFINMKDLHHIYYEWLAEAAAELAIISFSFS